MLFGILGLCPILSADAQDIGNSFSEFRNKMLNEFQEHRKRVFDNYETFLEGVWRDYDTFRAAPSPFVKPKPAEQPQVQPDSQTAPELPQPVQPEVSIIPEPQPKPELQPKPEPESPVISPTQPKISVPEVTPQIDYLTFDFYGATIQIPRAYVSNPRSLNGSDLATSWKELKQTTAVKSATKALAAKAEAMSLPDWYVMELVTRYAITAAGGQLTDGAVLMVHHILSSMGYNVRLASSEQGLLLLTGIEQMVYARTYVTINDVRYYVCLRDDCETLRTCDLPADADLGKSLDLVIHRAPLIPSRMHDFSVGNGRLSVSGQVDANLIEMLRKYPQMPIPCYAASSLQTDMRRSIVGQLRNQIQGMSQVDAVNALLHFVQSSFEYATDDQQFGYEKPFFLEELFYWPKCDCEDRSVLYVYLLRECLGMDSHLINYPGHECAAVCLSEPLNGTYYDYEGCRYYISDPTYIGAYTGMCMPDYRQTPPKIEPWY